MSSNRVYSHFNRSLKPLMARTDKTDHYGYLGVPEKVLLPILNRGVGIEIEIENVRNPAKAAGWILTKDGSLRNNGYEYLTEYGVRIYRVPTYLNILSSVVNKQPVEFSQRTSVHVHLDVRYFPLDKLENLAIVYTIFEDALFNFAGPDRRSNIFCVPLRYTDFYRIAGDGLVKIIERLRENDKYCAFNLASILDKGTVEFRHMEGNLDTERIFDWVLLLGMLVQYARRISQQELHSTVMAIKSNSQYDDLKRQVFYNYANKIYSIPNQLDSSLSDAKLLFNCIKKENA